MASRLLLSVALGVVVAAPAISQVTLRLAENPVRFASGQLVATGPAHKQFLFVVASADGPNNRLSLFDPRDTRRLGVDLRRLVYTSEGVFDAFGRARLVIPEAVLRPLWMMLKRPFHAQLVTYPGFLTLADEISNPVSASVGTGAGDVLGRVMQVLDGKVTPLGGVVVTLEGNFGKRAVTKVDGTFALTGIKPGRVHLVVDARALAPPCKDCSYPRVVLTFDVEDGKTLRLGYDVNLPVGKGGVVIPPKIEKDIVVTNPDVPGLKFVIPRDTKVRFPDGSTSGQKVQLVRVLNKQTPMPLPERYQAKWDFAVFPPGTTFDLRNTKDPKTGRPYKGAPITLVTDELLTVGSKWDLVAPDHGTLPLRMTVVGRLEVKKAGPGSVLETIEGGVRGGSWHGRGALMAAGGGSGNGCGASCCEQPAGLGCTIGGDSGDLRGEVTTPPYRIAGRDWRLTLRYGSARAAPQPVLSVRGSLARTMMLPDRLSISGKLSGQLGEIKLGEQWYDTKGSRNMTAQSFALAKEVALPANHPTGEYSYRLLLWSHYGQSKFAGIAQGTIIVENDSESPFGAGWTIDGHDRIVRLASSRVLVCGGDGSRMVYQGERRPRHIAGTGRAGWDDGRASLSRLNRPDHMVADSKGNVYVVDGGNHVVRRIDANGFMTTVAGTPGKAGDKGDGGLARQAELDFTIVPMTAYEGGVAIDEKGGRLFIADQGNHRVRYVDLKTKTIHGFAGTGQAGYAGDGGDPKTARFHHPCAIAFDDFRRLWIVDTDNHVIRRVSADGNRIHLVAGTPGKSGYAGDGGLATRARLASPDGIAVDAFGAAYVADNDNHLVRRITANGRIERFVGNGIPGESDERSGGLRHRLDLPLNGPADVAVDRNGNLYVSLAESNQILRVRPDDKVEILAGRIPGFVDPPQSPVGITLAANGDLYFSETPFHRIRAIATFGGTMYPLTGPRDTRVEQIPGGGYQRTLADLTLEKFDKDGVLLERKFPGAGSQVYEYSSSTRELARIKLPNGLSYRFAYTGGKLSSVTDPAGRVCKVVMQNGDLREWRAPGPNAATRSVTRFEYDEHRLTKMIAPNAGLTVFQRNAAGQYFGARLTGTGLAKPLVWQSQARGALAMPVPGGTGGGKSNPLKAVLWSSQRVYTDPGGHTHRFELDREGRVTKYIDPLGHETAYKLDPAGNPTSITRPGGARTVYTYDDLGRVLTVRSPMRGPTQLWRYEYSTPFPTPTKVTNPRGYSKTSKLDPATGRTTSVTDATGLIRTYVYERTTGLVTAIQEPYGTGIRETRFDYDALWRLRVTTDALGRQTKLGYTGNVDEVASRTDGNGNTTRYEYTPSGQLAKVTDPLGCASRYQYYAEGNLRTFTDAKNAKTAFGYDAAGRATWRTDCRQNTESYAYNPAENAASKTTRNGVTIRYCYDKMNRLARKSSGTTPLATFTYDGRGNLLTAVNANAAVTFVYDLADRVASETSRSPHQPTITVRHTYDVTGNRIRTSWGGYTVARYFDELDRVTRIADSSVGHNRGIVWIDYDRNHRRSSVRRSNGIQTRYKHDAVDAAWFTEHVDTRTSQVLSSWRTVKSDGVGNPLQIDENRGGPFKSGSNVYEYDPKNQLVSATHPDTLNPSEKYTYDCVGNRLYGGSAHIDCANRITRDPSHTYRHDANGNMVVRVAAKSQQTTVFLWSREDQLVEIREHQSGPASAVLRRAMYLYDALGRRLRRTVSGLSTVDMRFVYSGNRMILMRDSILRSSFCFLPSPMNTDERIASIDTGSSSRIWYLAGPLGSPGVVVDSSGRSSASFLESSFGVTVGTRLRPGLKRTDATIFGFTGRERDLLNLTLHRARYYSADMGRFLAEDPKWTGENAYWYVGNRPLTHYDLDGNEAQGASNPEPAVPTQKDCLGEKHGGCGWIPKDQTHEFDGTRITMRCFCNCTLNNAYGRYFTCCLRHVLGRLNPAPSPAPSPANPSPIAPDELKKAGEICAKAAANLGLKKPNKYILFRLGCKKCLCPKEGDT